MRPARWRAGFGTSFDGSSFPSWLDARHAHAALSVRINKSDQNDARGPRPMVQGGLVSRGQGQERGKSEGPRDTLCPIPPGSIRRDLENQVRSLIKECGLLSRRAIGQQFRAHVVELVAGGSSTSLLSFDHPSVDPRAGLPGSRPNSTKRCAAWQSPMKQHDGSWRFRVSV